MLPRLLRMIRKKKLVAGFKVKMTKEGTTPVTGDKWLTETGGFTSDSGKAGVFRTKETDSKVFIPVLLQVSTRLRSVRRPRVITPLAFYHYGDATYNETTGELTGLNVTPALIWSLLSSMEALLDGIPSPSRTRRAIPAPR